MLQQGYIEGFSRVTLIFILFTNKKKRHRRLVVLMNANMGWCESSLTMVLVK